jgi:hypothetical protein
MIFSPIKRCVIYTLTMSDSEEVICLNFQKSNRTPTEFERSFPRSPRSSPRSEAKCSCRQEYIQTSLGSRIPLSRIARSVATLRKYDRDPYIQKELRKTSAVCYRAAMLGNIKILRYAREGIIETRERTTLYGNGKMPWCKCACEAAARNGKLKCLVLSKIL